MTSFFLYSFMLIFSTLFVWLSEHAKTSLANKSLLTVAFFIIWVPSAIRYGVGTDFFSYYDIFNYQNMVTKNEYGFHFINYIIRSLGLSAQWAMAAYALLFTFVGFLSYPKKNTWIYHVLFITMLLFFSFNGIRQALAVVFIMLAIKYELENRALIFIVLVFVASLFHQSVLFLIPAILLSRLSLSSRVKETVFPLLIVGITVFIWLGPSVFSLLHKVASQLNLPYQHYFESDYFQKVNTNTGYLVLIKVLLALVLLINSYKLLKLSKNNWPMIVYSGFFIVFYSLASQSAAFGRLSYVYIPGIIYFLYLFLSTYSKKSYVWLFLTALAFTAYTLPYITASLSTINNPDNDNSYQTIITNKY